LRRDFDAVYIAVGAQKSVSLDIPGEDAQGVIAALDFLRSIASGSLPVPGRRVAVIGGGFTAVDAARSALRLGAEKVFILYRRTKEEMPASAEEIRQAEEEGVRIMYLVAPREVLSRDGKVVALVLQNQVLGEPGASARRRPEPVENAEFRLEVDSVIAALGQRVEMPGETALAIGLAGTIPVDSSGSVGLHGVFAGGDAILGASSVIEAIATAKQAAYGIDRLLMGLEAVIPAPDGAAEVAMEQVLMRHGGEPRKWRVPLTLVPGGERVRTFGPFAPVLTDTEALEEAARCFRCGCGEGCMICHDICKTFAYRKEETRVVLDEEKCVACGMCAWRCPNGNIEMIRTSVQPI
jgi:formate dehydrogenase major subunit